MVYIVDVYAGLENLVRACEIACAGKLTVYVYSYDENPVSPEQMRLITSHFDQFLTKDPDKAHLYIGISRPEFGAVLSNARIVRPRLIRIKFLKKELPIGEAAQSLLNAAYNRMQLNPIDVKKALQIAKVIARMEDSFVIQANHIAEAVQYRHRNDLF